MSDCGDTITVDEHWFRCQLSDDGHGNHRFEGELNDWGGESNPTITYQVTWQRAVKETIDADPTPFPERLEEYRAAAVELIQRMPQMNVGDMLQQIRRESDERAG